ncbi:helix-turn-helix domain-containing protein [Knoellia sp. S7-12]|uniref:helix-turn-helix domain-containing protein n=1 Tax=Knoellia sp. S7-12 TaxID=3126698 RepID=UPI003366A253
MTVRDVAEVCDVPVSTVHHWAVRGGGPPSFKLGKHRRFDAEDVLAWINTSKAARGRSR